MAKTLSWFAGSTSNITGCISNSLNYCEIFIVYTHYSNVDAGCILRVQPSGPMVGDPSDKGLIVHLFYYRGHPDVLIIKLQVYIYVYFNFRTEIKIYIYL